MVTRPQYSFLGWYNGDVKWNFTTDTVTQNITLIAKWEGFVKKITFDANGGTVDEKERKLHYGDQIGVLPTPKRDNYVFLGWYDSDDVNKENRITKETVVSSSMKLIAKWEPVEAEGGND